MSAPTALERRPTARPTTPRTWRPTATIVTRSARGTLTGAAIVAAVLGLTVASSAITYVSTFPTEASRQQLTRLTAGGADLSVIMGPTSGIGTVGGYTFYKGYLFLTSIAAVWAVLIATRSLRGQEDTGRWQLLLSGATRPASATAAVLSGLSVSVVVVAVGVFCGTLLAGLDPKVGFTLWDSVAHAASIGLVPAVFVGVGALTSQLARSRRVATGLGLGIFAVAFVLRMIGDAGAGTRWVRWLTPLGWSEMVEPLTTNRLLPVVPAVLSTVAMCLGAIVLAGRRDVGHGVLGGNETAVASDRGLGSPIGLALRLERGVLVAWLLGASVTGFALGMVASMTATASGDVPKEMGDILDRFGAQGTFVRQYFGVVFLLVAAVVALVPAGLLGAAAGEELRGRLRLVVAGPTRRSAWLAGRLLIAAIAVLVIAAATAVSLWVGAWTRGVHEVGLAAALGAGLNVVPIALVALGIGAVTFAVWPRAASGVLYALVAWSLVANLLASLVDGARWLDRLSLFHYLTLAPAAAVDVPTDLVVAALGLALCIGAVALFDRRDLHMG